MTTWASMTYHDGLDCNIEIRKDERWYRASYRYLRMLGLHTRMMDGHSFSGMPKNNVGTRVSFTAVFHKCINDEAFSPASYFAELVKSCLQQPMLESEGLDNLRRGFLSLPSFIREYDLQTKLESAIRNRGIEVRSVTDPDLDIGHHTDVIIIADDRYYRIWSYQATSRGLKYAKKKLRGERGEIDSGFHVLCPIDIYGDAVDYYGWRLYSDEAISRAADLILSKKKPETYQTFLNSMDTKMRVIYKFVKF